MCRLSDAELNCVSTKMRRMSACRQLLTGMSIRRYLPPIGTAGFERCWVSGKRRVPWPPPRMSASTSLFIAMQIRKAYTAARVAHGNRRRNKATSVKQICYNPGAPWHFRLIPREEKFYSDFQALADELKRGAPAARGDAGARAARLGQGRRDQGSRAQVRPADPRDHPAAEPDLRHAARSRGHPRSRALARRRDGRD